MEDFFDQEKTTAFVYLLSAGDNTNKVMISDDLLLVVYKKKRNTYSLKKIKVLKIQKIKLLFPLILGGIITPFAFLSFFVNLFYPWIHLISIMLGLLLFYVGWSGKFSFAILFKNGDELNHLLPTISPNLMAFIDFVNTLLSKNINRGAGLADALFFEVDKKYEDALFGYDKANLGLFPLFGYTYQQVLKLRKSMYAENLYCINPRNSGREILFQFDLDTNMMRPVLLGPVTKVSQIKIPEH